MNNMKDWGYYVDYDEVMGMWAVLDFEDRLIRYFPTKEKAIDFVKGE
jgi:hypothetical protein